jgi:hypothetical protein
MEETELLLPLFSLMVIYAQRRIRLPLIGALVALCLPDWHATFALPKLIMKTMLLTPSPTLFVTLTVT